MHEESEVDVNEVNLRLEDLQKLQKMQEEEVKLRLREFQQQSPELCKSNQDRQFYLYSERQQGISAEYKRLRGLQIGDGKAQRKASRDSISEETIETSEGSGSKGRSSKTKKLQHQKESSLTDSVDIDDKLRSNHYYRVFGRLSYPLDQSLTDSDSLSSTSESAEVVMAESNKNDDTPVEKRSRRNRAWACGFFNALTKPGIMSTSLGATIMTLSLVMVVVGVLVLLIMHFSHREITTMYIGPTLKTGYVDTVIPEEFPAPATTVIYANMQGLGYSYIAELVYKTVQGVETSEARDSAQEKRVIADMQREDREFRQQNNKPYATMDNNSTDSANSPYGHFTGMDVTGMPLLAIIRPRRVLSVITCTSLTCDEYKGVDISYAQYSLIVMNGSSNLAKPDQLGEKRTLSNSLPKHPRVQLVHTGTNTLLLISTPSNYLLLIVCAKNNCASNVSVSILSDTCRFASISMITSTRGLPIIGFQDIRVNYPCIITCSTGDCRFYERKCIRGVSLHDTSRLQLLSVPTSLPVPVRSQMTETSLYSKTTSPHVIIDKRELSSIAFTTHGRWTGALVNPSTFITRHINGTIAARIYDVLSCRGLIDSFGAVTASLNSTTFDYTELFHFVVNGGTITREDGSIHEMLPLYEEEKHLFDLREVCPYFNDWMTPAPDPVTTSQLHVPLTLWKFELSNVLRQFRGLPLESSSASNNLLQYVYCHLPTCEPGYVTIAVPWTDGDNISDTGMLVAKDALPTLYALRQFSTENYGVLTALMRITCSRIDCGGSNFINTASNVTMVYKLYTTYAGRFEIVHSPELETDNPMYILIEHKGVNRVIKCADYLCDSTLLLRRFNEEVCPLFPCFHMHISQISALPIFLHGTNPVRMTKHTNNYILPYVTY